MRVPNGWESYVVLFYAAFLALGIPILLRAGSWLLQKGLRRGTRASLDGNLEARWSRVPAGDESRALVASYQPRFIPHTYPGILAVSAFFIVFPLASVSSRAAWMCVLVLMFFLLVGLIHAIRKGDLDWQRSFSVDDTEEGP